MLTLNLISGKLKDEIKLRHIYNLQVTINYILVIIGLLTASVLLASKIVLQNSFDDIVGDTSLVTKTGQSYNIKVREINSKLRSVGKIQEDYAPFSYLLEGIANETPPDVTYSDISIDKNLQSIRIVGHAATRDGLLALNKALDEDKIFKNIDSPLKNILQKDDIDFEIDAGLDIDMLKATIK